MDWMGSMTDASPEIRMVAGSMSMVTSSTVAPPPSITGDLQRYILEHGYRQRHLKFRNVGGDFRALNDIAVQIHQGYTAGWR